MLDIEFIRFTPREGFRKELTLQARRVLEECPSDATAQVRAIFETDRFVLEFAVQSSQGRFRSFVGVPIPKKGTRDRQWQTTAIEEMTSEVSRQLHRWRRQRFQTSARRAG